MVGCSLVALGLKFIFIKSSELTLLIFSLSESLYPVAEIKGQIGKKKIAVMNFSLVFH